MNMHQRYRDEAEGRYAKLSQFLGGVLHEDRQEMYGTPEAAVDCAIAEYPVELLREVRHELVTMLDRCSDDTQLRSLMKFGLGVNLHFKKPAEARAFAEQVGAKLLAAIQAHFERKRHI